ncbi:MAG: hypothetical protein A3B34_03475 [Candidatus Sungbacteria bacterium RIFCSPLOWO2_01_FULL_54_21]|uniref:Transposase IS200-like domain-containing protein n=1 Tax=Candidatus Sungbacteria bacterium RIFCSPLOWO2_01_FULL_54_21 TaxID=1802279 RepID=A0A1G2L5T5_9BACT|nr:MAG: hypothetical protein A3B34_03475 [Candidatus Sungbacteria bacterium RIFCSPLOWO2_01_FULL_54_21]
MRKIKFVPGEFYHIYNRGNDKKDIFRAHADYARFLFGTLFFQAPVPIYNISRYISSYVKHRVFNIPTDTQRKIIEKRGVELVAFTFMPNHFHLLLYECSESGISNYMQRVLNAYTKYFNTKYDRSGHLFQGPFHAKYVETNEQLLYLSAYIHRNQRDLPTWTNKEQLYPWSSYHQYTHENKLGDLLATQRILGQFKNQKEYQEFVDTSGAKEKEDVELVI